MRLSGFMVWYAGFLLELLVIVYAVRGGKLRRFWDVCLYFGLSSLVSATRYIILQQYGLTSREYIYFYYYSDTLLTVILALVLVKLLGYVFELNAWNGIPLRIAILGFAGVALFSYGVTSQAPSRLVTHFVVEFSQNLYFAATFLVLVLVAATIAKRLPPTGEVKLVWLFAIYFSFFAANYVSRKLQPNHSWFQELAPPLESLGFTAGILFIICTDDSHLRLERH